MGPNKNGRCGVPLRAIVVVCLSIPLAACHQNDVQTKEDQSSANSEPSAHTMDLVDVTNVTGLNFSHATQNNGKRLLPEVTSGGIGVLDFDNDGKLDIYLTNGSNKYSGGKQTSNRLYRQYMPGRFADVTDQARVGDTGYGMGVAVGDYDNDGDADLFVANVGQNRLYRNDGSIFEDVTFELGLNSQGFTSSATFFDFDRDNDLDLYVVQYVLFDPSTLCFDEAGRVDFCGPLSFAAVSDELWRNDGEEGFVNVSNRAGLSEVAAAGLGVIIEDFNADGWPDVYIANDAYPNHMWINNRDGMFREIASLAGVALNLHGQTEAGMGLLAEDFDGDQRTDLFVTHLYQETNTCYQRVSDAMAFQDVSSRVGLAGPSMAYTGFGAAAIDLEHDGDLDILVANGKVRNPSLITDESIWHAIAEPNQIYINNGSGRFSERSIDFSEFCSTEKDRMGVSRALAVGDIDDDGDIDVVVSNIEGQVRIYSSEATSCGNWLQVDARMLACQRPAIGAIVYLTAGGKTAKRIIRRDGSYQSASQPIAHFGLGTSSQYEQLEVLWPNGQRQVFPAGEVNRKIVVSQSGENSMQ